jgi:hypothetical protein
MKSLHGKRKSKKILVAQIAVLVAFISLSTTGAKYSSLMFASVFASKSLFFGAFDPLA